MGEIECPEDLVYISEETKGFTRIRRGKGFSYLKASGENIKNKNQIERIKKLGIPPMWDKVWISKNPRSHLQATGYDEKGRKQYIYHQTWSAYRNLSKFNRIKEFGYAIPYIRAHTSKQLEQKEWTKDKVVSLVIQTMDEYHIRIGNQYYKDQNETYGLTTLRNKHFEFEKGVGKLEYKAKSGKYRKINLQNHQIAKLIKQCAELPGYEIFKYKDDSKKYQSITSRDVNEYLHQIGGVNFSSKDFRTWGGTTLAVEKQLEARQEVENNPRLKFESTLVKAVSQELGNTVSVCREYYIHPKILEKVTQEEDLSPYSSRKTIDLPVRKRRLLKDSEIIVLNILNL